MNTPQACTCGADDLCECLDVEPHEPDECTLAKWAMEAEEEEEKERE